MNEPTLILDEGGMPILEQCEGVTMPADYSFKCINNYVHCESPQYEDLQHLALGMASKIRSLTVSALPLPEVAQELVAWIRPDTAERLIKKNGTVGFGATLFKKETYTHPIPLFALPPNAEALRKENEKLNALLLATNADMVQALEEKEQLLKAIQQWQPIKTVPKDGIEILMHFVGRRPYATGVKWNGRCFVQLSDYAPVEFLTADGWMILPESPAQKGGAA